MAERNRTVFVIHGRDERLRAGMFTFLRAIGLHPLEWAEAIRLTGKPSPYIGEILESAFSNAQAVVALLTPDDEARLRAELRGSHEPPYETQMTPQARPNVLFEAGMAMTSHPEQTVLVQIGELRPFSDIAGRHMLRMDNSVSKRQDLANRLDSAGCVVNLTGTDWHKEGDLTPPKIQVSTDKSAAPSSDSSIQFVGPRVKQVSQASYAVWEEGLSGSVRAAVLLFKNEAQAHGQNFPLLVKASLAYCAPQFDSLHIDGGCWIGDGTDFCGFRVEETHALIVGFGSDRIPTTVSKRRKLGGMGGEQILVETHRIPRQCDVRVRLVDVDSGTLLYEGNFEFTFDPLRVRLKTT